MSKVLPHADLAKSLSASVESHLKSNGAKVLEEHEKSAALSVHWLNHLRASYKTGAADALLNGLHASLIETAGCLALGLVRPAIFSLRAQIDITFAWLFFKDHPIEWGFVERTGQGFRLVADVEKYLKSYYRNYESRLKLLRAKRTCGDNSPYACLSAHVHGQSTNTLPPLVTIPQLVQPEARIRECCELQYEISEYLSDVLTACFSDDWADFPDPLRSAIQGRLSKDNLKRLCQR